MAQRTNAAAGAEREITERLGHKLRSARLEIGLSQGDVGRALGCTFQQVQKYETGVNRISPAKLIWASRLFGRSLAWLLDLESDAAVHETSIDPRYIVLARQMASLEERDRRMVAQLITHFDAGRRDGQDGVRKTPGATTRDVGGPHDRDHLRQLPPQGAADTSIDRDPH